MPCSGASATRQPRGSYTERAPCEKDTAEPERAQRKPQNCDALLKDWLHDDTPVSWSVAHTLFEFERLIRIYRARHAVEAERRNLGKAYNERVKGLADKRNRPSLLTDFDTLRAGIVADPTKYGSAFHFENWLVDFHKDARARADAIRAWQEPHQH